jgi:hypothetical protein
MTPLLLSSLPGLPRQFMLREQNRGVSGAKRGNSMETSTKGRAYRDWRDAVDKRLHQIYCITIEDAGFDEKYLIGHWQSNEAPFDFVEWFANKYDLDPVTLIIPPLKRGS